MSLIEFLSVAPYTYTALLFIACGLGAPFPEEPTLLLAGYLCYSTGAEVPEMIVVCCVTILLGDLIPFTIGKLYGPRVLRIRLLRYFINAERLARFNRWFDQRGDFVVFLSRFVVGLRIVSFFTAGTMKMSWGRFILLDGAGIVLIAPPLIYLGHRFGGEIEDLTGYVKKVEHGILIAILAVAAIGGVWAWLRWQRKQKALVGEATETFVGPTQPGEPIPGSSVQGTDGPTPAAGEPFRIEVGPSEDPTEETPDPSPEEAREKPLVGLDEELWAEAEAPAPDPAPEEDDTESESGTEPPTTGADPDDQQPSSRG